MVSGQLHALASLPAVPIEQEARCTSTAGLDAVEKVQISFLAGNRTLGLQPAAIPTELSRLPSF
jgi:hypothetical protein